MQALILCTLELRSPTLQLLLQWPLEGLTWASAPGLQQPERASFSGYPLLISFGERLTENGGVGHAQDHGDVGDDDNQTDSSADLYFEKALRGEGESTKILDKMVRGEEIA